MACAIRTKTAMNLAFPLHWCPPATCLEKRVRTWGSGSHSGTKSDCARGTSTVWQCHSEVAETPRRQPSRERGLSLAYASLASREVEYNPVKGWGTWHCASFR